MSGPGQIVRAVRWAALLVVLSVLAVPPAGAQSADPAVEALREGPAYASPRALGPAAPEAEARLRQAAIELAADRRIARLAIVAGPVGAPGMQAYARRLHRKLGGEGTLVVTAPGREVVAVGPLPAAEITRRARAVRPATILDPADRVIAVARQVTPEEPEGGGGVRSVGILLGIALLGAIWALAWGSRREQRTQTRAVSDARAVLQVCLDAVRARAMALARRPSLPPDARPHVEGALGAYADATSTLKNADDLAQLDRAMLDLRRGLGELAAACEAAGDGPLGDDPFAGLCGVDPAHGPVSAFAPTADQPTPIPVCDVCKRAADAGEPPPRRMIPDGGRSIPFSEADLRFPGIPTPGGEGLRGRA